MNEFGYFGECEIPLRDDICMNSDGEFLVANSHELKAQIYADEIDFFIRNSTQSALEISRAVSQIYEAKARIFDAAKDSDKSKDVGKNVLLLDCAEFEQSIKNAGFNAICLNIDEIKFIYGQIGDLCAILNIANEESEIEFDILLAKNAKDFMLRQSGCYEISGLSESEILALLAKSSPKFDYKQIISFDPKICEYEGRRSEHCALCVEACPSVAILKNDEFPRKLEFSHVDCVACGLCASACPSGAIEFISYTREGIDDACELYEDKVMLIASLTSFRELNSPLKSEVLPLGFENTQFLSRSTLLAILQKIGANIVIYEPDLNLATRKSIELINEIFERIYEAKAIFLCENLDELNSALEFSSLHPEFKSEFRGIYENELQDFAARLKPLVTRDYGSITTQDPVKYGKIKVNSQTCTLCASCVGACNTGALYAEKSDNSLRFNATLCTLCGYCEESCPEPKTIKIIPGEFELKPSYFEYGVLARDELFKCVECGKEFATKKSVEKIAAIMAPVFAKNPAKLRTLYCCADCKAKLAMENGDFNE